MKKVMQNMLTMAALALAFSACTNLDEELADRITTDAVDPSNYGVGNKNNVNKAQPNDGLQSAFTRILDGTSTNGGFFAIQEGGTDEAVITQKGGDWYDGGLYIRMHEHDFTPQTWAINDLWNQAYGGIFQCNNLLDGDLNDAQTAQLRTLRAYFYWRLMDVFGKIPIVTIPNQGADQSTRAEAYAFIETELLAAIPDLPDGKQEYGRFNQAGAYALLSRMYLNSGVYLGSGNAQYQKAIDAADMVINSGLYTLYPDYAAVFAPDNVENPEHIFVAPFDEATATGETIAQMTLHYPSQLTWKLQDQPWNGFATLEDFYNSYDASDVRREANFIVGPQFDASGELQLLDLAYDKADPDGAPLNYTPFINELYPNSSRQGGARFGKFAFKLNQKNDMDNDYPILRYGEVLLNKAEAVARLGGNDYNNATTLALVNQIRQRAGVADFASMTSGDMLAERGRELFMESHRRTDLIRFGVYGNAWWEKEVDPKADVHKIMAIPIEQILATSSTSHPLAQNPGY